MTNAAAIRNVVGIIGNVISFGLFLSPAPTFYRIYKKKDVEQFQFWPYVATVLNCLLWIFYGLPYVSLNNTLVVTINGIGLAIELVYLSIFLIYDRQGKARKKVISSLAGEVLFLVFIVLVTMLAFHTHRKRTFFVGIFCDVFNILMYGSPLLIWGKVFKSKSVKYMPFWLSVANFCNGSIWTAYSLIHNIDLFILISNGLGTFLGGIQLIIYGYYWWFYPENSTNAEDDVVKPPAEIQMSGASDNRV